MHSEKTQDYLKAIYVLQSADGIAKTGALARQLGITAGSVSEMIKRMSGMSPPLIVHRQHHGATLTAYGRKAALAVIRRHRLLETFLHRTLGLGWEAVHEEAEALEHHLTDRMVAAIDHHLGHPDVDPHGEPIPDDAGRMERLSGKRLSRLKPEERFRVVRVDPSVAGMLDHLDDLGIGLDTTGRIVGHAPFDGPITLHIDDDGGGRQMGIGREVADRIYVVT